MSRYILIYRSDEPRLYLELPWWHRDTHFNKWTMHRNLALEMSAEDAVAIILDIGDDSLYIKIEEVLGSETSADPDTQGP
jgi:hypothetical protein